jgi:hypothetical protein
MPSLGAASIRPLSRREREDREASGEEGGLPEMVGKANLRTGRRALLLLLAVVAALVAASGAALAASKVCS